MGKPGTPPVIRHRVTNRHLDSFCRFAAAALRPSAEWKEFFIKLTPALILQRRLLRSRASERTGLPLYRAFGALSVG